MEIFHLVLRLYSLSALDAEGHQCLQTLRTILQSSVQFQHPVIRKCPSVNVADEAELRRQLQLISAIRLLQFDEINLLESFLSTCAEAYRTSPFSLQNLRSLLRIYGRVTAQYPILFPQYVSDMKKVMDALAAQKAPSQDPLNYRGLLSLLGRSLHGILRAWLVSQTACQQLDRGYLMSLLFALAEADLPLCMKIINLLRQNQPFSE